MSVEILKNIPVSGEAEEKHFGEHSSKSTLWVEFIDNESQKWFGCFPCHYPKMLNKVLVDSENETAFVFSGGIGYLININKKTLLTETDSPPLVESAIITSNPQYYLVGTFSSFLIFDQKELIKEVLPYMFVDGIYLKSQIGKKAIGNLDSADNQYEKKLDFELDLNTFELTIDGKLERTI